MEVVLSLLESSVIGLKNLELAGFDLKDKGPATIRNSSRLGSLKIREIVHVIDITRATVHNHLIINGICHLKKSNKLMGHPNIYFIRKLQLKNLFQ